jgi:hypothetical protein
MKESQAALRNCDRILPNLVTGQQVNPSNDLPSKELDTTATKAAHLNGIPILLVL